MNELHEVINGLEDGRYYNVYGAVVGGDMNCWWAAWWEEDSETFYNGDGEPMCMDDIKVIPDPLPEV